ncbi:MAG: NUDIX domain-containing protein [Abitibacteriaceae bacterium]|nr:NUDIX domain-containing protein [Abditibacteriaceae bacterium]MBV9867055.1 NUDIX domain-containing protein [Abditibacteriaceae bacterium]
MNQQRIRPIVICLLRHGDRILVFEEYDPEKRDWFCRPLGGGIEFGEASQAALVREIREELGVEIHQAQLLGIIENIFTYRGATGHEIVFIYDAAFVDERLYEQPFLPGHEQEVNEEFQAVWRTVEELAARQIRLVPEGLEALLKANP